MLAGVGRNARRRVGRPTQNESVCLCLESYPTTYTAPGATLNAVLTAARCGRVGPSATTCSSTAISRIYDSRIGVDVLLVLRTQIARYGLCIGWLKRAAHIRVLGRVVMVAAN